MPPGGWIQAMRLSMYVALPVLATVVYSDPAVMHNIITTFNYIIYPAEGKRPPSHDEMEKLLAQRRADKE